MLDFKKITLEEAEVLIPIVRSNICFSCESNFANLVTWAEMYENMYALYDGALYLKSGGIEDETYRLPLGADLQKGMQALKRCNDNTLPDLWVQQGERFVEFKKKYGDFYEIIPQRDAFDYVYLTEDLAKLSGKKYHSKRNHISAFSKKYNWEYREISEENITDVMACVKEWYTQNADKFDELMQCEKNGIKLMLSNMSRLSIKGGALYVDGKVVAFTLGSPINSHIFCVHIEKALSDYATAYTVINNQFAKTLTDYKYINREDDLGLEGLRKAKLSYKPNLLLKKYLCIPKVKWLKQMYHAEFGEDDNTFENELFESCSSYCKTMQEEDRTVSMCFALPCTVGDKNAKYIFAVTTAEEFRGRGYASALIEKIKAESDDVLILRPVNDSLIPFYQKLGFVVFTASNEGGNLAIKPQGAYADLSENEKEKSGSFTAMYYSKKAINLDGAYFPYSMP